MTGEEIHWIVNDNGELGVKIGNVFAFLYKGKSLVYPTGKHDDGTPILWRRIGKREFGECVHPLRFRNDAFLPDDSATEIPLRLYQVAITSQFGEEIAEDYQWQPLPQIQEQT